MTPRNPYVVAKAAYSEAAKLLAKQADREAFAACYPEATRNPHAVALGALGASKGGYARAKSLTAKERSEGARKAARARWAKVKALRARATRADDTGGV